MISESYPKMMTNVEKQSMPHSTDFVEELSMYRSGSAPPTVEGSLSAVGGLFSHGGVADLSGVLEEKMRSDPEYISYYYSNVNLNPRLPPPLLSKEDWRFAQRLQGSGGSIGDGRKVRRGDDVIDSRKPQGGAEWGLIGLSGLELGSRTKSIAEILQEDIGHVTSVSRHPSCPANRNVFDNGVESTELHFGNLHHEKVSMDSLRSIVNNKCMSAIPNSGTSASQTYASAFGASLSRSTTPDHQLVSRAPSPSMPTVRGGRASSMDKRDSIDGSNSFNDLSPGMNKHSDLVAALSGMALSTSGVADEESHPQPITQQEIDDPQKLFHRQSDQNLIQHPYLTRSESGQFCSYSNGGKSGSVCVDLNNSSLIADGHIEAHRPTVSLANSYLNGPCTSILNGGGSSPSNYHTLESQNWAFSNYGFTGYAINPASPSMMGNQTANLPPLFENALNASAMGLSGLDSRLLGRGMNLAPNLMAAASELQNLSRAVNHSASSAFQIPPIDPLYLHYLRTSEYAAAQAAALSDPSIQSEGMGNAYIDLIELQKAYLGSLLTLQKSQYGLLDGSVSQNYYGNSAFALGMLYPSSPLAGTLLPKSPFGSRSPVRHGERNMYFPSEHFASSLRDGLAPSLLDKFKSNKAKFFELSDISGHVAEFSSDQHGSRFIQQKLEAATSDEKNMIFHEIMPQAISLITDVFGNYVIQKFFEHGTASLIRELADQLTGHVLTLSLQMYGCRVIQKAMEVVDLDQKIKMSVELDGNVMRCIYDQNGNHVIQKCIECIPQESVQFIISVFYDQVVRLSTHPYGCRVIQRVLEHCSDPKIQGTVMDEILQSVCLLAQDQYGNYVVQHVLEHGKPHERSSIINKLSGQLVQMSQQKFSSNVVEKCLDFGTPEERKILVNEMLGSTDETEPLQVMMKDQFANYVVQKLLETCDNEQLELILNRIKVHLNALKKYTYGKHIVARVEKLVAAGEKRISVLSS